MAGKRVKQKASFQAKTPFVHHIYMKSFVYTLLSGSRCFDPRGDKAPSGLMPRLKKLVLIL